MKKLSIVSGGVPADAGTVTPHWRSGALLLQGIRVQPHVSSMERPASIFWKVRTLLPDFAACRWSWVSAGPLPLLAALILATPAYATNVWADYGSVRMLMSNDQTQLSAAYFYESEAPSYWANCTAPVRQKVKIKSVKFRWRKEIESFRVHHPKWGDETYEIDLYPIPQAHKWLLSTLVRTGSTIEITLRGCGSGIIPYLTAIEKLGLQRKTDRIGTTLANSNLIQSPKPATNETYSPPQQGVDQIFTKASLVAPLEIKTSTGNDIYYVKIEDVHTGEAAMTLFIYAGQTIKTKVPLGAFRIKYAIGKIWHGKPRYFGADTSYNEADRVFDFYRQGDQIGGYRIELINQKSGNLQTNKISADQF